VVLYVRDGSLVIVGLHFPNFTRMDVFDRFFNETFNLPWQHGDYHRTEFQLNPSYSLPIVLCVIKLLFFSNNLKNLRSISKRPYYKRVC
jgi:hypothetical protein